MHRVSFGKSSEIEAMMESLGLKYMKTPGFGGYYLGTFEIDEADSRWPQVDQLVREHKLPDIVDTLFSDREILDAEWVRLVPRFLRDYPQPEDGMAWRQITYEKRCPSCGVGYRQKAPFRLAREPRLGRHDFWSLFWAYTVFCTPRVLEELKAHEMRGYEVWDAIIHSTDQPSRSVSQLVFPVVAAPGLAKQDRQDPERCWRCGTTKYAFHLKGYMHLERRALRPETDVQLTYEWFGSGTKTGYREVLISNRLATLIVQSGWRGVALKPLQLA